MYAAAWVTPSAVFQCLPAISVNRFFTLSWLAPLPALRLYLVQAFQYAFPFWRSALLLIRIFRFSAGLTFPLCKLTVVLFHNALHFSERPHKCLHIGITVLFQNIGQFIQFGGDFLFRLLYLLGQCFTLFAFE